MKTPNDDATAVEVCNRALDYCSAQRIRSLDKREGREARLCSEAYDPARKFLLAIRDWSFALTHEELVADANYVLPGSGDCRPWDSAYAYPSDCLRFIRVIALDDWEADPRFATVEAPAIPGDNPNDPNKAERRRVILTNEKGDKVWSEYIKDEIDGSKFDETFKDTLSWLLASRLALPLGVPNVTEIANNIFQGVFQEATDKTLTEQQDIPTDRARRARRAGEGVGPFVRPVGRREE